MTTGWKILSGYFGRNKEASTESIGQAEGSQETRFRQTGSDRHTKTKEKTAAGSWALSTLSAGLTQLHARGHGWWYSCTDLAAQKIYLTYWSMHQIKNYFTGMQRKGVHIGD